ncbi:MAG: hypothetical protein H6557_09330 [Lewinellaceae bacterium]|nr:hypothetical protein [Phaeodactylibacter sp.]MCB9036807.1 hypothetical protein [Lewinellaceae bacterium]
MKKILLLFGLLLGCSALAAQAVIKGVVFKSSSCNENALEPLPDVQVSADGASSVYSQDDGTFKLQFHNKKPGDATRIWARKEGYVFLNEKGYEDFILFSDPNRGIVLILCTTGAYSRAAPDPAEYTKILQEVSSLKKNLAEINNSISQSATNTHEYQELQGEKENIERRLEANEQELKKLSARLSKADWKAISFEIREAMLDAANSGAEGEDTEEFSEESIDLFIDLIWESFSEEQLDSLQQMGDPAGQKEAMADWWKAYLFATNMQFEEAERAFERMAQREENNPDVLLPYAAILAINLKNEKAIAQLERALNIRGLDKIQYVEVAKSLSSMYQSADRLDDAEEILDKASKTLQSVKPDSDNPHYVQGLQASLFSEYGDLYYQKSQFQKSEQYYRKAIEVVEGMAREGYQAPSARARIESDLGAVCSKLNKYDEALSAYKIAYQIYSELVTVDRKLYLPSQSSVLYRMANLFSKRNDYKTANDIYGNLEQTYYSLAQKSPEIYQPAIANVYAAQGRVLHNQRHYFLALNKYDQAMEIFENLSKEHQETYSDEISSILNAMGLSHLAYGQNDKAKAKFDEALKIDSRLAKRAPETYETALAETFDNLGGYFQVLDQYDSAHIYYNKALEILERYDRKAPRVYKLHLLNVKQGLGTLYFQEGNDEAARKELGEADAMARELIALDSVVFMPDYAKTIQEHGIVYLNEEENAFALGKFEQALNLYEKLSKEQKGVYEIHKANVLWGLGKIHSLEGNGQLVRVYFDQALALCREQLEKNEDIFYSLMGRIYLDFAGFYVKNRDFSGALDHYQEAEEIFNKLNGKNRLEEYQNTLGEIQLKKAELYLQLKQYNDAENATNIARQIFVDLKDYGRNQAAYQGMLAEIENAAGELNLAKEDYYRALQNYNRARSYYQDLRKTEPETYRLKELETMAKIGEIHLRSDNNTAAQQQLEAVIDSVEAAGGAPLEYRQQYQAVKANAYMNLGHLFFSRNPERSIDNFEEAKRLYSELSKVAPDNYLPTLLGIDLNMGHLYYNGENIIGAKEKYEQVLSHFNGNNHRTSTAMLHVYVMANRAMGNIFFSTYNYEQAAQHFEACIAEKELLSVAGILDKAEFLKQAGLSNLNGVDRDVKLRGEHQLEEARDIVRSQSRDSRAQQMLQEICGYIDCY